MKSRKELLCSERYRAIINRFLVVIIVAFRSDTNVHVWSPSTTVSQYEYNNQREVRFLCLECYISHKTHF